MKEFHNGSDMTSFNKEDVIELIKNLDAPKRQMLRARLISMNEHERSRAFSSVRNWVLRKTYPDKFKSRIPFYEELKDILSIDE